MFIFWWKEDEIESHFIHILSFNMSQGRLQIDTIHSGQFCFCVIFFFNFALLHNWLLSLRQQQSL